MRHLPAAGGITVGGRFYFAATTGTQKARKSGRSQTESILPSWGAAMLRPYTDGMMD
jgi:hypothetical protein